MSRPVWLTRVSLSLLCTVSLGAFAAPAEAATTGVVSVVERTKVRYQAGKGRQNKVVVTRSGRTITVDDQVAIKAGAGCKAVWGDKTRVRCTTRKAPTRFRVYTYDRNDTVVNGTDLPMTADGGSAKDRLTGGPRADRLLGGNGADTIRGLGGSDYIDGGAGNDMLYGMYEYELGGARDGRDTLYGEAGDDRLSGVDDGRESADRLDGGTNTAVGDDCRPSRTDTTVRCDRA